MEILIKSFNRPYYLDKCIQSIKRYLKSTTIDIKVLDDGTPKKYLDYLKHKHPEITIVFSSNYQEKSAYCEGAVKPSKWNIPIDFWEEEVKKTSEYFLLLEDDNWFVTPMDISDLSTVLRSESTLFLKLFWLGNPDLVSNNYIEQKHGICFYEPKLFSKIPWVYNLLFYGFNNSYYRKIMKLLDIGKFENHLPYYTIYAVAGAIFKKDYFLSLWNNHQNVVDERLQIYNALKFTKKEHKKVTFANTPSEMLKTGFVSSATNNKYEQSTNADVFDMFIFNKILNEAWYNGMLDISSDVTKDIQPSQIKSILSHSDVSFTRWQNWSRSFKEHYTSFGCKID
ncbi:hypothetical protein [Aquimarina sp. SS2-1]|uniref:hypothetical protein n=1 Tax=Aquimarina besae TaxID=3342247 RepID=UPI00366C0396